MFMKIGLLPLGYTCSVPNVDPVEIVLCHGVGDGILAGIGIRGSDELFASALSTSRAPVGLGPLVLKVTVPVASRAFSETKLAVESAQSVPCELVPRTR